MHTYIFEIRCEYYQTLQRTFVLNISAVSTLYYPIGSMYHRE